MPQSSNNHLVTYLKIFHHQLAFEILNEVSQSNIFLVFFLYIWSFKVNRIFHHFRTSFFLSKLNINWFLLISSFFSKLFLLYLIKVLATGRPVKYIFETLYVLTALLQDQTNFIWIPSSKLIYELFLM